MNNRIGSDIYFYDDDNVFAFDSPYIKIAPEFIEIRDYLPMKWERIDDIYVKETGGTGLLSCLLWLASCLFSWFLNNNSIVRQQRRMCGENGRIYRETSRTKIDKTVILKSDCGEEIAIKTSKLSANDTEVLNQEILAHLPYPLSKNFAGFY